MASAGLLSSAARAPHRHAASSVMATKATANHHEQNAPSKSHHRRTHQGASLHSLVVGRREAHAALAIVAAKALIAFPAASAAPAVTVFAGEYNDPNHPGCPRSIDSTGKIEGIDPVPFKRGAGCSEVCA